MKKNLVGLMALGTFSSFANEVVKIIPDMHIVVYKNKYIKLKEYENCGFDHISYPDQLCFKGKYECIKNEFPAYGYSDKLAERFFSINEGNLNLKHLNRNLQLGQLQLVSEGEETVRKVDKCLVKNPYKVFKIKLDDDISVLSLKKSTMTKRVVASGAVKKNRWLFQTLDLRLNKDSDKIVIKAMVGTPNDWEIPETRKYIIDKFKLNGMEDFPDYGYFEYFFNPKTK